MLKRQWRNAIYMRTKVFDAINKVIITSANSDWLNNAFIGFGLEKTMTLDFLLLKDKQYFSQ